MITLVRRHIGQMVSALDSWFRGLGSRPGRVNVCVHGQDTRLSWCFPPPTGINPLTSKISLVILLTVCHTIHMMLVWRIWNWIN